ncbi:DNA-binding protein Ewg-like isoform X2 [Daktulosphaira vitifoliae]|uniref:DNA-binding protein Ewg-like isoform X2 n=1 Tax=Daktulosphaira vitifoliae TaxID=58002 RepID=UPI0021AA8E85|nr:DNA-binding protein Ewg-like isoform X2 [Daktulosphaira vitifoliae]
MMNRSGNDITMTGDSDLDDDACLSSDDCDGDSNQSQSDLMSAAMGDDVTAQLAAAEKRNSGSSNNRGLCYGLCRSGPVGMAAAAAIVSSKKRKRPHSFETNPSIRKRQHNRLLRKLKVTIDEFATRVGQQAIVLVATPGKENTGFKCFGAKPLEDVVKNLRSTIMDQLDTALAQHAPPPIPDDPTLYELPPLILDGIPTPVEKMTQAQLRAFIPLMLKYSTGRGKPGWGRETTRPPWWPKELPWANVRMDARCEDEKQKISWTRALRQIVINCYKYHGREDLLPTFNEEEEAKAIVSNVASQSIVTSVLKFNPKATNIETRNSPDAQEQQQQQLTQYSPAFLHSISNVDGSMSIFHVDPNNPIITLPDGTQAHVQGVINASQGANGHTVHSVHTIGEGQNQDGVTVEMLNNVPEATMNQEGQIIITGEDGQVSSMITVPVNTSLYQTVVQQISDGSIQVVTPVMHMPKSEPGGGMDTSNGDVETISVPHQLVAITGQNGEQVLQLISLKDSKMINAAVGDIKEEGPNINNSDQ